MSAKRHPFADFSSGYEKLIGDEGGLQVIRHTLLHLGFPLAEVHRYADTVRREHYDALVKAQGEHVLLRELLDASELLDIAWRKIPSDSAMAGKTLIEAALRGLTGATVVAISREGRIKRRGLVEDGIFCGLGVI